MRKWLKIKVFRISSFILPYLRTRWFCKTGHHFSTTKIKEDDMNNALLDKGIITPYGEISKDKINLVTGTITQPFAEMVWVTTGGDMETINRLTDVLVTMNTPADREKLFKIIKLLCGLMGLHFSEEAEPMDADPDVLEYFIFSFTADFGEVMQDIIADGKEQRPAQAAFLNPHRGEKERRFFHALTLRSRADRSLVSCGFAGAVLTKQGEYTFSLKIALLPRNKSTAKE